jgi:Papain family cysteine protease
MAAEDLIAAVESVGTVRILNCLPSPATEEDWKIENALAAGILTAPATLPTTKDLRDDSWWSIGDQANTGSCVGWAVADSVLRWHFTNAGRLQPAERMSPRFLWMAAKETDEFTSEPSTFIERAGTSLKAALEVARRYGSVRDTTLPFAHLFDGDVNTFYAIAAQLKIVAYFNLGRNLSDWRQWLAGTGPILTRLTVDRTWELATQTSGHLTSYDAATARGGHAVALVGYTPNGFIVRNSWGVGWGDKGYAYASSNYATQAFTEAYGVTIIGGGGGGAKPATPYVWHR